MKSRAPLFGLTQAEYNQLKLALLGAWAGGEIPEPIVVGNTTYKPSCPGWSGRIYHKLTGRRLTTLSNQHSSTYIRRLGGPGCFDHSCQVCYGRKERIL